MFRDTLDSTLGACVHKIIAAAETVYAAMGTDAERDDYVDRLATVLCDSGLEVRRSVWIAERYKGFRLSFGHRLDLVVDDKVAVLVLAAPDIEMEDETGLLQSLRLGELHAGLLINFHASELARGIRGIEYGNVLAPLNPGN